MAHSRSQRHLREIQGYDSSGEGSGGAATPPNIISNPDATGGISGAPGTPPTNWALGGSNVFAFNTTADAYDTGIPAWDVQVSGNVQGGGNPFQVFFDQPANLPVEPGRSYRFSLLMRSQDGSFNPAASTVELRLNLYEDQYTYVTTMQSSNLSAQGPDADPLASQLFSWDFHVTDMDARFVQPSVMFYHFVPGAIVEQYRFARPTLIEL